ncbi:hypothetical protein [Streptomyces sp. NPDC048295]|uniref:hypothetical protein n=1 Tax=Streptomyces sp. NPDC048295 TaxID=3154617 RepID=UPI00343AEBE8
MLDERAECPGFKENVNNAVQDKKIAPGGDKVRAAADAVFGTPILPDPEFPIVTPGKQD